MAENVKQFKDVTLVYSNSSAAGNATLTIKTDMPGAAMAVRRTISMPPTAGERRTATFPLDNPLLAEGKMLQAKVVPPADGVVILYEGSLRARAVGTYLDGASGDVWETQPLSF